MKTSKHLLVAVLVAGACGSVLAQLPAPTAPATVRPVSPSGDPHGYFDALRKRPDVFAAYSLRDDVQVARLRNKPSPNMAYVYPTDPDPRRQDATKIVIPEGRMGPGIELRMSAGPSRDQNVLITFDFWWGREFRSEHSRLDLHKECPLALTPSLVAMRADYSAATAAPQNQPSGGPFTLMSYIQAIGKGRSVKTPGTWMDTMKGFPRVRMPRGLPNSQSRGYTEALATAVNGPMASEMGIVGDRWHRFWHYFERAPEEDFVNSRGERRRAYRYSAWFADTVRGPILALDSAIIGLPDTHTTGLDGMALHMGAGRSNSATTYVGRGDLVAYSRNWVALHGTPKGDVSALLQKPVN